MKAGVIATIITASFVASCAIKVDVKKDAKNSALKSGPQSSLNATDTKDFLKQLDGLRSTAADLLIKELSSGDFVGSFRNAVRKYRTFIIEKSAKSVVSSDSFYTDTAKQCRSSGLSLNADDNNEMLGMILKTAVLAKISESDVAKINAGLAKELQAVTQFITMELGVDIQGTSEASEENGVKTTKGNVKIKLKPIDGESVDAQTKKDDEVQVLSLSFERALAADMLGTFVATIDLAHEKAGQPSEATGAITVSRVKDGGQYTHDVQMSMGVKGETPSFTRQIIVKDNPENSMQYEFVDILNAGSSNESRNPTVIDLKAGTQCKGVLATQTPVSEKPDDKTSTDVKDPVSPEPTRPTQSPTQSPVQSKTSPTQMK
jgi:hypothetical protein